MEYLQIGSFFRHWRGILGSVGIGDRVGNGYIREIDLEGLGGLEMGFCRFFQFLLISSSSSGHEPLEISQRLCPLLPDLRPLPPHRPFLERPAG
jgi:hypothetical protein